MGLFWVKDTIIFRPEQKMWGYLWNWKWEMHLFPIETSSQCIKKPFTFTPTVHCRVRVLQLKQPWDVVCTLSISKWLLNEEYVLLCWVKHPTFFAGLGCKASNCTFTESIIAIYLLTIFAQNCAFSGSIFALYIKVQLHNFTLVFTKFLHKIAHLVDPSSQLALPGLSGRQVLQKRGRK